MPALIINHPSFRPRLEPFMLLEAETPESVARAYNVMIAEQVWTLAIIRAQMDNVVLRTADPSTQALYMDMARTFRAPLQGLAL